SLYREKDAELRQWATERVVRGKSELFIASETLHAEKRTAFDRELISAYYSELKAIATAVDPGAETDLLGFVLRIPDVSTTARETLAEEEWNGVMALVQ